MRPAAEHCRDFLALAALEWLAVDLPTKSMVTRSVSRDRARQRRKVGRCLRRFSIIASMSAVVTSAGRRRDRRRFETLELDLRKISNTARYLRSPPAHA